MLLFRKHSVPPSCAGYLFRKHVLVGALEPGIHRVFDPGRETSVYVFPTAERMLLVINQEVLTKDGVALRASLTVVHRCSDPTRILSTVDLSGGAAAALGRVDERLRQIFQVKLRDVISSLSSEQVNEDRARLTSLKDDATTAEAAKYGVEVVAAQVIDLTFPKHIQELFARQLEAKVRAKADLENARTAVAAARALKNVSEITRGDETIRFHQYLEVLAKIAAKGRHTFVVGGPGSVPVPGGQPPGGTERGEAG